MNCLFSAKYFKLPFRREIIFRGFLPGLDDGEVRARRAEEKGRALANSRRQPRQKAARVYRSVMNEPKLRDMTAMMKEKAKAKKKRQQKKKSLTRSVGLKARDAEMLRKLTEKLAKQLLRRDADAASARRKVEGLEEKIEDLHAWQKAARNFVQRSADKRKHVNEQFAARDRELVRGRREWLQGRGRLRHEMRF